MTETQQHKNRVARKLYYEIGNPYTDEGGHFRVHCPECDVRMRLISWPRYVCGKCGAEWDVVK